MMLARALLFLLIAIPGVAQNCESTAVGYRVLHMEGRVVAVWYPTRAHADDYTYHDTFSGVVGPDGAPSTVCGKRVPLVVFSHGDLGCGLQSIAFTEELARHGYVVAAPDHADAFLCHTVPPATRTPHPHQPDLFAPDTWNDTTVLDRRKDMEAVIDGLLSHGDLRTVIDARRIGLAGHSLGGYTVVGMAGGWPSWVDPRIRAVLALSPYVMPFQVKKTLGSVHVPLMYQGGTLDVGITPFLKRPKGAYGDANPPVYFMELKNASHFAWVNCGKLHSVATCLASTENFRLIDEYGIAFFDRYLRNLPEPILSKKETALADYRFRTE